MFQKLLGVENWKKSLVLRNGITALSARFLNILIALVLAGLVARSLEPDGLGTFKYWMSIASFSCLFVQLGLPAFAVRTTAQAIASNDEVVEVVEFCFLVTITLGVVVFSLGVTLLPVSATILKINFYTWFTISVYALVLSLQQNTLSILNGFQRIGFTAVLDGVLRPGLALLLFCFCMKTLAAITPIEVLWIHIAAVGISMMFGFVMLSNQVSRARTHLSILNISKYKHWLSESLSLAMASSGSVVFAASDIFLLYQLSLEHNNVGFFTAGQQLASLALAGQVVVNSLLAPKLAGAFIKKEMQRVESLIARSAVATTGVALLALAVMLSMGKLIIGIIYSDSFFPVLPLLTVMVIGQVFSAANGPVVLILNMAGKQRTVALVLLLATLLKVPCCYLGFLSGNIFGFTVATTTANVGVQAVFWLLVFKSFGFRAGIFPFIRTLMNAMGNRLR